MTPPSDREINMKNVLERCNVEKAYEWDKWCKELPFLSFPKWVEVKVIPPFGGAVARFLARKKNGKSKDRVSIYCDAYGELGYYGEGKTYWEVYPDAIGDDCARFELNDVDRLMREICSSIRRLERLAKPGRGSDGVDDTIPR